MLHQQLQGLPTAGLIWSQVRKHDNQSFQHFFGYSIFLHYFHLLHENSSYRSHLLSQAPTSLFNL